MNRDDAVRAAAKAAGTVYGGKKGDWFAALNAPDEAISIDGMANFVTQIGSEATAEMAYRYAVGVDVEDRPWDDATKPLVAALQVFVATYGALVQIAIVDEAKEAAEAAEAARQPVPEAMAERNMSEQVPSLSERVEGLTPPLVAGVPVENLPLDLLTGPELENELDELKRAFTHVSDAGGTPDEDAFERACAIEVELGKRRGVGVSGSGENNNGGQAA